MSSNASYKNDRMNTKFSDKKIRIQNSKQNKTLSLNNHFDKRPNFNLETIIPNKNIKRDTI